VLRLHRVGQHLGHETMPELDVVAADKGHVEPFARTLVPDEFAGGPDAGVTAAQDQDIVREAVDCHWLASLEMKFRSADHTRCRQAGSKGRFRRCSQEGQLASVRFGPGRSKCLRSVAARRKSRLMPASCPIGVSSANQPHSIRSHHSGSIVMPLISSP